MLDEAEKALEAAREEAEKARRAGEQAQRSEGIILPGGAGSGGTGRPPSSGGGERPPSAGAGGPAGPQEPPRPPAEAGGSGGRPPGEPLETLTDGIAQPPGGGDRSKRMRALKLLERAFERHGDHYMGLSTVDRRELMHQTLKGASRFARKVFGVAGDREAFKDNLRLAITAAANSAHANAMLDKLRLLPAFQVRVENLTGHRLPTKLYAPGQTQAIRHEQIHPGIIKA